MRLSALGAVTVVNVALAGALALLWSDEARYRWREPAALPPALDEVAAPEAAEATEVSQYRETLDRPLFIAARKPAPKRDPAADAQAAADTLKDVRLLGTYGSGGRRGIIILRDGKVERVPVGGSIGHWKVAGEQGRGAALARADGERRSLELAINTTPPSAPAAPGKEAAAGGADQPVRQADGAPAAAAPAPSPRAAAPAAAPGADARNDYMRQRLERANARRALQGLPPLPQ